MDAMILVYIAAAFVVGVVVGWLTMVIPAGGRSDLTREETRRLNTLIDRAMSTNRGFTITLYSEGALIDQVTIQRDWRY